MRNLCYVLLLFIFAGCRTEPAKIFENTISGRTYYHILFTLTSANSSFAVPPNYRDPINRPEEVSAFSDEGIFEVFIRASDFPIRATGCRGGWIILRMPATTTKEAKADEKIAAKKVLWERLNKIYSTKSGSEQVVIELNPYIRVIDPSVPKIELEYCNVFFRHADGAYVPYVGPLGQN